MKIKFNLDDEILSITTVVRTVCHENNKYYAQVFLDECLYKL